MRSSIKTESFLYNKSLALKQTVSASSGFPILSKIRALSACRTETMPSQMTFQHYHLYIVFLSTLMKYQIKTFIELFEPRNWYLNVPTSILLSLKLNQNSKNLQTEINTQKNNPHCQQTPSNFNSEVQHCNLHKYIHTPQVITVQKAKKRGNETLQERKVS